METLGLPGEEARSAGMAEVVSRWQRLCWGQPGVLGTFRCAGDIQVCRDGRGCAGMAEIVPGIFRCARDPGPQRDASASPAIGSRRSLRNYRDKTPLERDRAQKLSWGDVEEPFPHPGMGKRLQAALSPPFSPFSGSHPVSTPGFPVPTGITGN